MLVLSQFCYLCKCVSGPIYIYHEALGLVGADVKHCTGFFEVLQEESIFSSYVVHPGILLAVVP